MSLIFNQIIISDLKNKESKKIEFKSKFNLVTSDSNSKGKSIILKSLYHTMGANCQFDNNFNKSDILFDLSFQFNGNDYRILRYKNDFVVLQHSNILASAKYGDISVLSNFYKNELGMFVYLMDRDKKIVLAPPAYLFVPYYLDQDVSWKKEQEPFEQMGQFEKIARNKLYYYHLGLYSEEYQNLALQLKKNNEFLSDIKNTLHKKDNIYTSLKEELDSEFVVNLSELNIEIRNLKTIISSKLNNIEKIKTKIYDYENQIISLELLNEEIDKALSELKNTNLDKTKHVSCPNCKYEFDINLKDEIEVLYNREFLKNKKEKSIIDIDNLKNKVQDLKQQLKVYLNEIDIEKNKVYKKEENYKKFLNREAIENLLKKKLEEICQLEMEATIYEQKSRDLQLKINSLDEKTIKVGPIFKMKYKSNLISLGVKSFDNDKLKAFYKLAISGSLYVRSTLAFFYAFLDTKEEMNSNNFICPLIVDSPREGEQDDRNSSRILEYILTRDMKQYQVIVASVDADKYIDSEILQTNNINVIKLDGEENHLLNSEEYKSNLNEIEKMKSYFI